MAALDLFASVTRPVASKLRVEVSQLAGARVDPAPPERVFHGFPVLVLGECDLKSEGAISLTWESGQTDVPVKAVARGAGSTLRLLRGSRLITDFESRVPEQRESAVDRRSSRRYMQQLEELSRTYGLASRAMSLVAVVERPSDRPGLPPETRVVPVGLPQDMEFGGVFGAPRVSAMLATAMPAPAHAAPMAINDLVGSSIARPIESLRGLFRRASAQARTGEPVPPPRMAEEDQAVELAALLEPDGGMSGADLAERILKTLLALVMLAVEDQRIAARPFRGHRERMVKFLEKSLPGPLSFERVSLARRAIEAVRLGRPLDQRFSALGMNPKKGWDRLATAIGRTA
jgi:hypothetical protein